MCRDISKNLQPDSKSYDTLDAFSNLDLFFSYLE